MINMSRAAGRRFKPFSPLFFCALGIAILLASCRQKMADPAEFGRYIESYTTGIISKESPLRIRLAADVPGARAINTPVKEEIFSLSPSVEGKAYWLDARTIEFRPEKPLEGDKRYEADLDLKKLLDVPDGFAHFRFDFQTIKPDFTLDFSGLKSSSAQSGKTLQLDGTLITADAADPKAVEKTIHASFPSKTPITWEHNGTTRQHHFTIKNLARSASAQKLTVSWDGDPLGVGRKSSKTYSVPALGDFAVLDARAVQDAGQYVLVQFSDPIRVGQDLNGLLGITNAAQPAYTIEGSEVKLYPAETLDGSYSVFVNPGVENIESKKISKNYQASVLFENRQPAVSIPGKGIILPASERLLMPFEAVNLNAVDVSIIKIYESNIPQYLQTNSIDGDQDLRRVAKPVRQATIRLDQDKSVNLHRKTRFMLDVDKLIRTEPGAIYRIMIGFRPEYSVYPCTAKAGAGDDDDSEVYDGYRANIDEDDEFWQRYDNYYPYGYNWQQRNDPCSDSYYNRERWASRNVLASNIGLVAKRGTNNSMLIAATDLLTAKPMGDVHIQVLDYQNQVIDNVTTGSDGMSALETKRKPYLLVAKKGGEKGYLKLDDGSALPMSRFKVGGSEVQEGLKGFIYGERGVWRPGDSLFVTFILDDQDKKLPKEYPVDLELYNPQGQLYKKLTRNSSTDGFYSFRTATENSSPTGNWRAKVMAGGASFEKTIRIETIMPNRLKVNLDFGNQTSLTKNSNTNGTLNARWLFGGTAQNLQAKVDAFLSPENTAFKGFENYVFDDPTRPFSTQTQSVFDGRLNENGVATVNADIQTDRQAPGRLRANFLIKVFEPGGNFSIGQTSLPYNVYDGYVGLKTEEGDQLSGMLVTDKDHPVDIVAVDKQGKLFSGSKTVSVELYKVQWRWWWDEGENEFSNFTQDQMNKLVRTEKVNLVNGKGRWKLRINQPEWGRYLIRVVDNETGHATGKTVYIDWPNWAERLQKDNPTEASMLSFTADKEKYRVGEKATLTLPSPANGRALISIENGHKVIRTEWLETRKGQTQYTFPVEKGMAPNVFVNVTMLQPHSQTANDLPIRMYGAIPIEVEDPGTVLKPVISMPETLRPETRSAITVSEASGKPMTYTIALVDEGLLDITGFSTPDPHAAFYTREALGVKTWDLYDYVIGAYGGGLQRILGIGGDQAGGASKRKNPTANRFKAVVKYLGPFTSKGGRQTHTFTLPQYIGSVKAMVIAGHEGAFGSAEKTVTVKKPLMVLATLPRVLGPEETIKLPVTVFAMEKGIKTISVEVQSNAFSAGSVLKKTVDFQNTGEQLVNFDLRVRSLVGLGKVRVIAQSGAEKAVSDVEIDIRNPNPPLTQITETILEPGKEWKSTFAAIGVNGTNKASVEVSSIPAINLQKRLGYLIQYPYGCVEQTTSSVFPQLYLSRLTELSAQQRAETERNIRLGVSRLNGFQLTDGGMGYWPGASSADEWSTNYAGHFMLEAQALGYTLPAGFLEQWKRFQRTKAQNWAPDTRSFYGADLLQAYRLYLLALAKSPESGAMNRLREFKYLSPQARWRLAAAYKLAGKNDVAAAMIRNLPETIKPYQQLGYTYGSDLRDEAMILETLTLLNEKQRAGELLRKVAARLSQDSWYSTQSTAYALISVAKFCGANPSAERLQFVYQVNTAKATVNSTAYLSRLPVKMTAANTVSLKNSGKNRLYVRVVNQGQPAAATPLPAQQNPDILTMRVGYFTLSGKPVDPQKLTQGTDFLAQVNVHNPGKRGRYDNLALSQLFPSGWEILNTRLMNNEEAFRSSANDYRDIRDDRVQTYFSLNPGEEKTFLVMLNAAYLGRYYLPPTGVEAMYDATIRAQSESHWIEVVSPYPVHAAQ
ncbi:MAG: hypothetical protein INR69_14480 [Mucilaginibacter polytrichastri]|nr:hypothetical protein [Mucilaginibacter polytrichastri]